ncbi:MAG: EamA family transporter [Clostridiales bacterium]|jgi:transporter family protein|nr:EamA family transporter [Clostridiales bacterium]
MELWLLYAAGAAIFAALTTILAKIGLKNVDSHLATAVRTIVVAIFAWVIVLMVGSQGEIGEIGGRTWVFLVLSGLATGASWLCFFRALKLGEVNKVVPIDKSSTILTMILAFIILSEPVGLLTVFGMILMGIGTWLMLEIKRGGEEKSPRRGWLFYAVLAAVFASLTAIFAKIGIVDMEANLWTAIRTMVVLPLAWLMVFKTGGQRQIKAVDGKSWVFLVFSGLATGVSWLLFYHALQIGRASHVVPIDKLSIVLTMIFARLFLGERFSKQSLVGLVVLTFGTLLPVITT